MGLPGYIGPRESEQWMLWVVQDSRERWGAGKLESDLKGGNVASGRLAKVSPSVARSSGHVCVLP